MSEVRRGAVRSEASHAAILHSTARLFAERGYENLTMEAIAADAGVGKQTIYRWWPSKGHLIAECLLEGQLVSAELHPHDTGDIRADLLDWLNRISTLFGTEQGEVLVRSLISAAADNEVVGRKLRDALGAGMTLATRIDELLGDDVRGTRPGLDIVEAFVGAVLLRALSRVPSEPGDAERLVDAILGAKKEGPPRVEASR